MLSVLRISIVVIASMLLGGCVFESFEEPTPALVGVGPNDAGNNNTSSNNVTTTNNVTSNNSNNATTPDMGPDVDMGVFENWRCPRVPIGTSASPNGRAIIKPLNNGRFLASWPVSSDTVQVVTIESDGTLGLDETFNALVDHPQRVELLSDGTSNFYVLLGASSGPRLADCGGESCGTPVNLGFSRSPVAGFWNGGEYPVYVIWETSDSVAQNATLPNYPRSVSVVHPNLGQVTWFASASLALPPDPGLTNATSIVTVSQDTKIIREAQRLESSDPIAQTAEDCSALSANVGKAYPVRDRPDEIFADVQNGNDVVIGRFACADQPTALTDAIVGLRDWYTIPIGSNARSFYITSGGLHTAWYDGGIDTIDMESEDYELVAAARNADNSFGVLTVDADGNVHFRLMADDGECL